MSPSSRAVGKTNKSIKRKFGHYIVRSKRLVLSCPTISVGERVFMDDSRTMSYKKAVVLLSCGSFNPTTYLHLRLFERAKDYLQKVCGCHVVEGIISPCSDSYQAKVSKEIAPASHRIKMVELAVENSSWIRVDPWESERQNWTPTLHVLQHFREDLRRRFAEVSSKTKKAPDIPPKPMVRFLAPSASTDSNPQPPPLVQDSLHNRYGFEVKLGVKATDQTNAMHLTTDGGSSSGTDCSTLHLHQNNFDSQHTPDMGPRDYKTAKGTPEAFSGLSEEPHLMFLCGADLFQTFGLKDIWKPSDVEAICRDFGLVVISRYSANPRKFIYDHDILSKYEPHIHVVNEWIQNDVSSTKIRRALERGESVKYLLPENVRQYIYTHGLYHTTQDELLEAKRLKLT